MRKLSLYAGFLLVAIAVSWCFAGPAPVYPSPSAGSSTGANPTATISGSVVNGSALTFLRSDGAPALAATAVTPGAYTSANVTVDQQGRITAAANGTGSTAANPTASITGSTINGSASTFMRSDAAPAIASGVTLVAPNIGTVASGVISACTSTSMVMVTPVLGTPTSGTLTNCTGLPASGVLNPQGNAQSGTTYTFVLADGYGGPVVSGSNAGATTFSIPTDASVAFPNYTSIVVLQLGAGVITISAVTPGTTTITSSGATPAGPIINAQYQAAVCYKTGTNAWTVFGNIK